MLLSWVLRVFCIGGLTCTVCDMACGACGCWNMQEQAGWLGETGAL